MSRERLYPRFWEWLIIPRQPWVVRRGDAVPGSVRTGERLQSGR
jgi:hypothetical protein